MNETRRVHSIARRIGNSWTLHALGMLITLDVLLILLSGLCAAYYHVKSVLGDGWQPELTRSFVWETPDQPSTLMDAEYRFQEPDGHWHAVTLGPVLSAVAPFALALCAFESLILLSEAGHAHRKARRLLKPLNKIARDMQAVSQLQSDSVRYEDRLRDLESAIEHLSPTRPGAKLRTGAQELNGLENAINGLLVRMHESYRQQAQFVSDASHELRTPIAVIQGYAHMLARWGKEDPQVLDESIAAIQSDRHFASPRSNLYDRFMSSAVNPLFYPLFVKANAFTVSSACIGCGQCVRRCPANNITLHDGKPVWGKDCTHCMACICYCPAEAIEYGKKSLGKPRYHFEAL